MATDGATAGAWQMLDVDRQRVFRSFVERYLQEPEPELFEPRH